MPNEIAFAEQSEQSLKRLKRKVILASLRKGCSVSAACKNAKVGRTAFYEWLKTDKSFRAKVRENEAAAIQIQEDVLFSNALRAEDDPKYQSSNFFWLKNHAPERYADKFDFNVLLKYANGLDDDAIEAKISELLAESNVTGPVRIETAAASTEA